MSYKYTHFIPQNTAPKDAKCISVYDSEGRKICAVPLGGLKSPDKEKLYSFGLLSDIHIVDYKPKSAPKFDNALSYFEEQGAKFCCHCGDLTDFGFWIPPESAEEYPDIDTTEIYTESFDEYKRICDLHPNLPVYGCCGNHESYTKPMKENLTELEYYTGHGLTFSVAQQDDLFIFVGQPSAGVVMSDADLQWLYETLEANRNKRCFVFVHSYIEEDSGDPLDLRENGIFEHWSKAKEAIFMSLLDHYKNTVLLHGHSHTKFACQALDESANYTEKNGFKSVHIPSCGHPRDIANNQTVNDYDASEGYLVDVYDDYVVFNGMDFINRQPIPLGVFKIDTTFTNVIANTFVDDTGIIVMQKEVAL